MRLLSSFMLGVVVVIAAVTVALASASRASAVTAYYWSIPDVLRRIDGARVPVNGRVVRVKSESALCSGVGPSRRGRGVRTWQRFLCTYTTFTKAGVDRDLEFRVWVTGPRRFKIYNAHWIGVMR
jgi:hypothetical protein